MESPVALAASDVPCLQEHPDRPYKNALPGEIMSDCEQVTREIVRFAGEELLDLPTTIHWGEATREGCIALRQFGFRALADISRLRMISLPFPII